MVKVAIGRERPLIEDHPPLARAPSKLSFPSAHATSSLAAATAYGRVDTRTRLPLYALATGDLRVSSLSGHALPVRRPRRRRVRDRRSAASCPGVGERTLEERMLDFVADRAGEHAAAAPPPPAAT